MCFVRRMVAGSVAALSAMVAVATVAVSLRAAFSDTLTGRSDLGMNSKSS